jgi:perosamine synthetase
MITPNSHMNPVYGKEEIDSVMDYLSTGGWIMEHAKTREMERMICEYTGARYAHMVPSATSGLLIAAMLAGIKPHDSFAVGAWTQAATVNGAVSLGGIPYIVDVDTAGTIDLHAIPSYVKTVFVTSINGRYINTTVNQIRTLQGQGIFVIEDAAQSLGSFTAEGHIGTFGDVGVFSFGAPKIITTGQGGCIVTNRTDLNERILEIKNFGRSMGVTGETYNTLGLNFKFTDLQAAFGIEQLRKLPDIVKRKKEIFEFYRTELKEYVNFLDTDLSLTTPTYPDIYFRENCDRQYIIELLKENNIGTRLVYSSLSSQPFHNQWARPTPVTSFYSVTGLQLPGQVDLTDADLKNIVDIIKGYFKRKKYNPTNDKELSMIKNHTYKNLDKLCFVLVGQPRYIGTETWENNFVKMLKETKEEHPAKIDITFVLPEWDTVDKSFWEEHNGLPIQSINFESKNENVLNTFFKRNNDGSKTGLIPIRKKDIESYLRSKLDFVDHIEFVYCDPYEFVYNMKCLIENDILQNKQNYQDSICIDDMTSFSNVSWMSQHFASACAYAARKEFFDSLSSNSPIFKMRYDYYFSDNLFTENHSVTLWNLLCIYFDGYMAYHSNLRLHPTSSRRIISPEVIYEAATPEFVHGGLFSADYMHIFNIQGFKTYAEEFIEWISEDLLERSNIIHEDFIKEHLRSNTMERKILAIPEIIINQFFIDKKFSMKHTGTCHDKLKYFDGSMTRNMTDEIDYYRALWYDWNNQMIKKLT